MSEIETISRAKLLTALAESDEMRRAERADRIEWLSEHQIPLGIVVGQMDTIAVLGEARDCFIEGHYIAALLLSVAFLEHAIMDALIERKLAKHGIQFTEAIKLAREANLFQPEMLLRADHLREIRNPFTHRKAPDHTHSFGNRYLKERVHPRSILEKDAKDALALMYAFFHSTLRSG